MNSPQESTSAAGPLQPATLRIGKQNWSIEVSESILAFYMTPDGREEGEDGTADLIIVDHAAYRVLLCGNFDWWALGEVIVNLMRAVEPARRGK